MRALSSSFFARPAEVVGPELIGCRLVKRQPDGSCCVVGMIGPLKFGIMVKVGILEMVRDMLSLETEAYSQAEPA